MANEMKKAAPFGMKDKVGYMFGDFGNDFTFLLSSSFLMKFYTDVMGVNAAIVGMVMMIARFVDAFTDVGMGQIVDHSKPNKDGKFRPWIKRMCGPVAIASFLIYQSGLAGMPYGFKVAWLFVTYILWGSIFYTSINIPYGSMLPPSPLTRRTAPICPLGAPSALRWPTWSSAWQLLWWPTWSWTARPSCPAPA